MRKILPGLVFGLFAHAALAAPLTDADAGKTRAVAVGATVELRLAENPSTGSVWTFDIDPPSAATVTASEWTAQSRLVGAPGMRDVTFRIQQAGRIEIRAREGRPWEGADAAVRRLQFSLDAR